MGTFRGTNLRRRATGSQFFTPPPPIVSSYSGLEHYWPMDEATGVTRVDRQGSNDFTVTTGPATQVAAHLGNGTDNSTLDASSFTAGPDGWSLVWWQEALNAGTPTIAATYAFTGQGSVLCTADVGQTNVAITVSGRPGGVAKGHTYAAPFTPEVWHFFALVVDAAGVRTYQGDDTGTALDEQFNAWDSGDSFVAPTGINLTAGTPWLGIVLDDMAQYSKPIVLSVVEALYNGGVGVALL